jgi:ribose transport system substrate-binding protein
VGSLIAWLVSLVILKLIGVQVWSASMPIWIAVLLVICAWVFLGLLVSRRLRPNAVVFIAPARFDRPFFSELTFALARSLASRNNSDLIVKVPLEDYSEDQQNQILREIVSRPTYRAIIWIPVWTERPERLLEIWGSLMKLPLVTLDVDLHSLPTDSMPMDFVFPPFVGGDNAGGGELAADLLADYFEKRNQPNPIIAVFTGSFQAERHASFLAHLRDRLSQSTPPVVLDAKFDRYKAKEYAFRLMLNSIRQSKPVDAFFCTNDEMALGVISALHELEGLLTIPSGHEVKVVGYDGIKEMKRLIDSGDRFVLATIDVCISEQANRCADMVAGVLSGAMPPGTSRINKVKPKSYRGAS